MAELKSVGSEKLQGDEKIKRILELTYYQSNEGSTKSSDVVKEGKSGVYGVVKEKDGYYVKKGLNENSLDYIGGMFMKNKNRFSSYNEALKKLEFLVEQETFEMHKEIVDEATKYVLKQPKPAPAPEPELADSPAEPVPPPPAEDSAPSDEEIPPAPEGDDVEDPDDFMKVLQKMAGKLQQKMNKYEDQLESEDYKAIINQVLSAVDFNKLEDSDKEEILSQFEADEEMGEPADEFPSDGGDDLPVPEETNEWDGTAVDGVASLDELINTPLGDEEFDDEFEDDLEDFGVDPKAEMVAKSDMKKEYGGDPNLDPNAHNPLDSNYEVGPEAFEEEDVDEQIPFSGPAEEEEIDEKRKYSDHTYGKGKWDGAIDSDVNNVPGESSDDGEIKELDLDELTNMVNTSVKETLGKYFE